MSENGDQQFREISAYLIIGKDLFNEMYRSKIPCDENYVEILCSPSSAYVEGPLTRNNNEEPFLAARGKGHFLLFD